MSEDSGPDIATSDSFTETTHQSWLSRLGQSIVGVLIGLALIVGAIILLFWNEGRAIQTARSLTEGEGIVVDGDAAKVDPANEGKLIHISGDLVTKVPLADPEFGVTAKAARLVRTVETYQWKEESHTETRKNLGGSEDKVTTYTYTQVWSEPRIDSSRFRNPAGHENPQPRYRGFDVAAHDATLGAFRPGEAVLRRLATNDRYAADASAAGALRERVGMVTVADGVIFLGADPGRPRIGDMRITYHIAPTGPTSLIGRQSGADFAEYQTKAGDRLLMASTGTLSANDMFKAAEAENRILTWILRAVGSVVMFIGWLLVGRPLSVLGSVVPLIGDVLGAGMGFLALMMTAIAAPVVIAIAWFWYRPLVSVAVLVIGFGIAYAIKMRAGRRVATTPAGAALLGIAILGPALIAAIAGSASKAAADGIMPGEWKVTQSVVMNGAPTPPQIRTRCLSPDEAADTAKTFTPEYRTTNSNCRQVEFSSTATSLRWHMLCTGQLDMDVAGDFSFDSPRHYSAKISSKGAMAGREFVDSTVSIEGQYIGDCH
jgi:Transmembrane protein 43/Protein of unknown function (DUF3617)